jgi:cation diffusion facilitator family transporter
VARGERLAIGSIALGCLVLGLKAAAWWLTSSAALYSDALESIVNVVASILALAALRVAAMPADSNHPYGHAKAELFSAIVEGGLIVVAAFSIFEHAWATWHDLHPLGMAVEGIALNALATVLNGVWSWLLVRAGRRLRSPALVADGQHLMTDVVTSLGVLTGLGLVVVTGYVRLDPILAVAIGVYVLWSGMRMISGSVGGLMDAAPEQAVVRRIRELVAESATGAIEAHDLRMRHAGRATFVDFHLVVPGSMSVAEAHAICDRIEARLRADMEHLMITIHVEPEEKAKQHGVPVL